MSPFWRLSVGDVGIYLSCRNLRRVSLPGDCRLRVRDVLGPAAIELAFSSSLSHRRQRAEHEEILR